ncbi:thymus-specific serine protease-like [Ruditapes philippinarum]|uniref:thymus-specific serine protease-like n=1 Tax=Ruditapes philippinarum TaxID=129788 RepID=UPI00295B8987|nr:thymus-specific serine protease-like [Ruditapes philippinarum]
MKLSIFLIVFVSILGQIDAFVGRRLWQYRQQVEEVRRKQVDSQLQLLYKHKGYKQSPVKTYYLKQPLDHFNALSKELGKTYKQRYYVNAEYWFGPKSPVFLYIGGEGTLSSRAVEAGEIVDLAKKHNALIVGAEHRFYGASLNDDGLQLEELQHLSSQQALADLATFVNHIQKEYGIPDSTPWVSFGGSYPGALSAWFRLKYPHLVVAAVASSAPVQAVTNFEGYNEVVAASFKSDLVGGSQECLDMIKKGFQTIDSMIADGKYDQLRTDFKSCNMLSMIPDQVLFVSNLAGYFMGVAQYNNEIPGQNISHVCKVMLSTSDPYQNLITLNQESLDQAHEPCMDNCFMNYTSSFANTTVDKNAFGPGIRQWTYQTCSQFGYYQTCDVDTTCPFSHLMDLENSDIQMCRDVFKIDTSDVDVNVQFSNDYYGGNHTQQSKIIFVNGSIDPWHKLSILTNQTTVGSYSVFIPGTAHCADLSPQHDTDTVELKNARQEIASLVGQFLEEAYTKKF